MKPRVSLLGLALLASLTAFAWGQWQAQPQIDPRFGPVYPVNPAYNFHSASNYDPFHFNWATGRWDYAPIPYGSSSRFPPEPAPAPGAAPYMPYGGQWPYAPAPAINSAPETGSPPAGSSEPKPDDSELWSSPATRPDKSVTPKIVKFEGRIVAVEAVSLADETYPHLLLRLRNDAGATGTVDAGQRLEFPEAAFDPGVKGHITVTGQLGVLDGHLILFADHIAFGSKAAAVDRPGNPPK